MGKCLADMPDSTLAVLLGSNLVLPGICTCQPRSKFPIAPMGDSRLARCLQGGGVYVGGGTVAISWCTISGNSANGVRAHAPNFPSPNGKLTFCSLFAGWRCSCRRWHSGHLIMHHQWEHGPECKCRRDLKFSHRPHGKIADMLAPTHACTTANAPVNYSLYVQQRPSKVPIAPMGELQTRLPQLFKSSNHPDGKMADALALILA